MLARTYSRKGHKRSARAVTDTISPDPSERSPSPIPQRRPKKPKIEVEVVQPSPVRAPPRHTQAEQGDIEQWSAAAATTRGTVSQESPRKPASMHRINEPFAVASASRTPSPSRAGSKPPSRVLNRSSTLRTQSPAIGELASPVKDLADLFAAFPPASSSRSSTSTPKTSGVAKRMHPLRRSQTSPVGPSSTLQQSLLDTHTSSSLSPRKLALSHTEPAMDFAEAGANTPSSQTTSRPLTPQRLHSQHSTVSITGDDPLASTSSLARPSIPPNTHMRTYAGQSRSFLVAMPISQAGSLPNGAAESLIGGNAGLGHELEDSLEEERESYTSLRLRYGIDASEDDPIPPTSAPSLPPSPRDTTKRKGKGRSHHHGQQPPQPTEKLPEGMMNDLRSISELRSKGEARRFLDEVGYLFEGLDPSGALGVRRGSAMEIVDKLCDSEFAKRAQAADFLGRAWDMLRTAGAGETTGDKVLNAILVFFAALVAKDPIDLADLAQRPTSKYNDFVRVLFTLLEQVDLSNDPLWLVSADLSDTELKQAGFAKIDVTTVTGLWKMAKKHSGLFEDHEAISSRLLISFTLSRLPHTIIPVRHLPQLMKSLRTELDPVSSRVAAYTSGLPLFPALSSTSYRELPSLAHLDNCLALLDSHLLGQWYDGEDEDSMVLDSKDATYLLDVQRREGLGGSLIALCIAADVVAREGQDVQQRDTAKKCIESTLRVLINLTHDSLPWCDAVLEDSLALPNIIRLIVSSQAQRRRLGQPVKPEPKDDLDESQESGEDEQGVQLSDRLCLALGLLTNLVQCASGAKSLIRDIRASPSCPGKRSCIHECTCTLRTSAIETLVHVYAQLCGSSSDLDAVIRGHVAVLFGLLMQNDKANQRILLEALPGKTKRKKLESLVENARDFTAFYVRFAKKAAEVANGEGLDDEDDERVEYNDVGAEDTDGMRMVVRDTKGEDVANGVIAFLESLRRKMPVVD